ncbi:MAG: transcription antitermination factor NusB [Desulfobulbaceae bacterium]|nr:transcription antitermination factor NusB [Desulfobulbaceae bacterium]
MGKRRKSREIALQFLYSYDFQGSSTKLSNIEAEFEKFSLNFEPAKKAMVYARELVVGTEARLAEIDDILQKHSHNWRLERMSSVDRNVLRIAVFEMIFTPDVPSSVSINEALEIAKRYSHHESVSFINGILDAVAISHGSKEASNSRPN